MNATNNLALAQRGTVVVNHDNKAMNEQATKQDLHNQGIQIDSEFVKVDSRFANVDNQITNLRTDMNAGFDRVDGQFTNLRTDMDAGFDKVYSRFEIVDSQFANLRTDIDSQLIKFRAEMSELFSKVYTMFDTKQVELNKTLFKFGSLYFTMIFAVLSIDRWWR